MSGRSALQFVSERAKNFSLTDTIIRYHPYYYSNALRIIEQINSAGMPDRLDLIEKRCATALRHANQAQYGRGRSQVLQEWPVLAKEQVRDEPEKFTVKIFPMIAASTGGTTGQPIKLSRSIECIAAEQAFIDRLIMRYGATFRRSRIAVLRADEIKDLADTAPPYGIYRFRGRRLILSNAHLSRDTIGWYVNEIKRFKPEVLWVYPSMLANMIKLIEESDLHFSVPIVLSSSETMGQELYGSIEEVLAAKVIDYYGQGERVCFASSTRPNEYWFDPAYGRTELILQENPMNDGAKCAKIVSTGYWNKAMPLVRYDTGDLALLSADTTEADIEDIALGIKPFAGVAGRTNEFLITEKGGRIGGLNHLPRGVNNILRLQIIQETYDSVRILALTRQGFSDEDGRCLERNARKLIPHEMKVSIEKVISLDAGSNGKTPFVIRRVEQ